MKKQANNFSRESKTINILCATDDKYAPYCGVMLTSFLENHKAFHTDVYIIVKNRLKEEKRLKRLEERYDVKVNIVEFPFSDITSSFPIGNRHWTIEMYYRLFAPVLLPKDIDRILYLDCDIIVDGDVSEMYFSDINNISALVVIDAPTHVVRSHPERLGYQKDKGYFNSGMMLMNLNYWQEHDISRQCIEYIRHNYSILDYCDQDVLNVVLLDSKKNISVLYNYQDSIVMKRFFDLFDDELKKIVCTQKPKIIHYTYHKPWTICSYKSPYANLWEKYSRISFWKEGWLKSLPYKKPYRYFIKRYFLWPFGLKRQEFEVAEEWKNSLNR